MTKTRHVCLVDDDPEIRSLLSTYLTRNGLRVGTFADGTALNRFLARENTDLVILDVMLPVEDGFSLCRKLRAGSELPIMMLTARDEEIDRIVGLELGADDYLCKPFNPRELLARINNLLRRSEQRLRDTTEGAPQEFKFADWTLNVPDRQLSRAGSGAVHLSGGEFVLLTTLLSNANRVLSRNQLAALTRGRDADPFDRSIDVQVSRLRQILGDNAREPRIIKTVYGKGYVISAVVTPG